MIPYQFLMRLRAIAGLSTICWWLRILSCLSNYSKSGKRLWVLQSTWPMFHTLSSPPAILIPLIALLCNQLLETTSLAGSVPLARIIHPRNSTYAPLWGVRCFLKMTQYLLEWPIYPILSLRIGTPKCQWLNYSAISLIQCEVAKGII